MWAVYREIRETETRARSEESSKGQYGIVRANRRQAREAGRKTHEVAQPAFFVCASGAKSMPGSEPVDLPERDRDTAIRKVRSAWRDLHPEVAESETPAMLRATSPERAAEDEPEERPTRAYLTAFRTKLKELLGIAIPEDDWNAAHRSAMSSAGGKASAAAKAKAKLEAREPEPFAFAEPGTGFLVALWLPPSTAERLAIAGGEPAEALHVTLCYCGAVAELDELTIARAIAAVDRTVSYRAPLEGKIAGYGRFTASPTSDARDVFYASVDVPHLAELREAIATELIYANCPPRSTHGFTPHVTLAYLDPEAPNPVDTLPDLGLRFGAVTVMIGERRIDIPLGGFAPMLYSTAGQGGAWRLFTELPQGFAEAPEWVNVMPKPGTYQHPQYGAFTITRERNERFLQNHNDKVYQDFIPITLDIEHNGKMSGAVGYFEELRLNADGSLDAKVGWTDVGRTLLAEDRFKYFSPEWWDAWNRPGTDLWFQDVLIGGAICTRPYFKEDVLAPLVASEGQLFVPETRGGGRSAGVLRLLAATEEVPVEKDQDQKTAAIALSEDEIKRFRELETKLAEREQAFGEQATKLAELETAKAANEAEMAALKTERQERKFTDIVRGKGGENDGATWPGAIKDNVADLVALAEAVGEDSDVFKNHVARMAEAAKTLAASKAFEPIGSSESGEGGDAWGQLEAKKREIHAADPELTDAMAMAEAIKRNPDLHRKYTAELRQG